MPISNGTCAALAEAVSHLGHAEVSQYFIRYGCVNADPGGSRATRAVALVHELGGGRGRTDEEDGVLRDVIEYYLRGRNEWQLEESPQVRGLLRELMLDGLEFSEDSLIPTTPTPAALGVLRSSLEREMEAQGLTVAARHYREALDNFGRGNFTAAGGAVGSFLENMLLETAGRLVGDDFTEPRAALDRLRQENCLQDGQWNLLRGCWAGVQEAGRHHGVSEERTALLRIHLATAAASYLTTTPRAGQA